MPKRLRFLHWCSSVDYDDAGGGGAGGVDLGAADVVDYAGGQANKGDVVSVDAIDSDIPGGADVLVNPNFNLPEDYPGISRASSVAAVVREVRSVTTLDRVFVVCDVSKSFTTSE